MIEKSNKDNYSEHEILGIFTRTLNYTEASDYDSKRLFREMVKIRKDESIYLDPYSGSVFINFSEEDIKFYENLLLVLLFIKYIIGSLYIEAIKMLTSKKHKIRELRKMLNNINAKSF